EWNLEQSSWLWQNKRFKSGEKRHFWQCRTYRHIDPLLWLISNFYAKSYIKYHSHLECFFEFDYSFPKFKFNYRKTYIHINQWSRICRSRAIYSNYKKKYLDRKAFNNSRVRAYGD